jgi:hypothetical protein
LITLNTSTEAGPGEASETWRELFRGSRGVVLWDDKSAFVAEDGTLGARGAAAAPLFRELESGLAALIINSQRHSDAIAMLYSPASLRTLWMLDNQPQGDAWSQRETGADTNENAIRLSVNRVARAVEHLGLQHRFIASTQLLDDSLERQGYRVLLLPQVIALSALEAMAIRRFVAAGGTVIADGDPGQFDGHSRRLRTPLLAELFAPAVRQGKAIRLATGDPSGASADPALMQSMATIFAAAGIKPGYRLSGTAGEPVNDVETYQFNNGGATVLALLGDPLPAGKSEPGITRDIVLHLPAPAYIYDLRAGKLLDHADRLSLRLDPQQPRIFALSDLALPAPAVAVPAQARLGETAVLKLALAGTPVAATDILRVEFTDPAGHDVPYYSRKIHLHGAVTQQTLPLALNDPSGEWIVRVTDILSGQTATATLKVVAR